MAYFKQVLLFALFLFISSTQTVSFAKSTPGSKPETDAYLFVYFTGNKMYEEQIRFALSYDGYNYKALNRNLPVIQSDIISETGGVRDPHILRSEDGKYFYMVVTDMVSARGWDSNRGMVLLKSKDLVHWTHTAINITKTYAQFKDVVRVWAPQTIYDKEAGKYMIYFSMKTGPAGYDIIYYAYANSDFTALESAPKQLFFHPENKSCIDGDIVFSNGKYHLFYKTEGHGNGIKKARSEHLTSGWVPEDNYLQQTRDNVEGSGVFKLNNSDNWILMYDVYTKGRYEFCKSSDLQNFSLIQNQISMDFHPRHGTVLPITKKEAARLEKAWAKSKQSTENYPIKKKSSGNPVLDGYFADPDILYAEKTGKFYMYPTSDGFRDWSGNYFQCFVSDNLKKWYGGDTILTLGKDVKWAHNNAWAPCIVEKKINGKYQYFYYFTAQQKIGVATSDNPDGPFKDSGRPIVADRPEGINRGQVIDPDVFTDPATGKSYLYWGNGFMAGAELNDDMTSIKAETTTILRPDKTFREGTYVFYRNGTYYFMWSEDDTRSPNYRVRYATSKSPLGEFTIPQNNLVLVRDDKQGIYGTGHNAVIQLPGTDKWYIVYHRFMYHYGIKMGRDAGWYRQVCIDELKFAEDGSIIQVKPTHKGIKAVKVKK